MWLRCIHSMTGVVMYNKGPSIKDVHTKKRLPHVRTGSLPLLLHTHAPCSRGHTINFKKVFLHQKVRTSHLNKPSLIADAFYGQLLNRNSKSCSVNIRTAITCMLQSLRVAGLQGVIWICFLTATKELISTSTSQ